MTQIKIKRLFFLALVLFLLNATFIIPFLLFYKQVPLTIHFINNFSQNGFKPTIMLLFIIFWHSWLVVALCIFVMRYYFDSKKISVYKHKQLDYYVRYLLFGFLFVFASSSIFPWNFLFPLKNIFKVMQFPWRFLGFASLFLSVCGGFGLYNFLKRLKLNIKTLTILSLSICIYHLLAFTYLTPTMYGNWDMYEKCYWTRKAFYSDEDYLYKGMDTVSLYKQGEHFLTNAKITNWEKKLTEISFSYETTSTNAKITLPLINYPGYVAINQDGKIVSITNSENHMMVIKLPPNSGYITIHYKGLTAFKIADFFSLASLLLLTIFIARVHKRNEWTKLI